MAEEQNLPDTEVESEEEKYARSLIPLGECPDTDEAVLRLTQKTRKQIAEDLLKNGLPEDQKNTELALRALADMDRTALGSIRSKNEQKSTAVNAGMVNMVASLLNQAGSNPMLFKAANPEAAQRTAPTLPDDIVLPEPVEGEMDIGNAHGHDYESFADRFRRKD